MKSTDALGGQQKQMLFEVLANHTSFHKKQLEK